MPMSRPLPWWSILWRYSTFEAADSAWSLIVVSTYFGAFVQVVLKRPGADFGWVVTIASLIVAAASPLLGAAADLSGRRQPYLRVCVLGVAVFTGALGFVDVAWAAFGCFIVAYICVNAGFTLFTGVLPAVSDEENISAITSATVGMGYVGGLVCIVGFGAIATGAAGLPTIFLAMAVVYCLFASPAMFLSPDFPARRASADLRSAYRRVRDTFRSARRHRHLFRFLIGDFLYENAVASVITVMGLYSRNVMGFPTGELRLIFAPAIVIAALSAWGLFHPLLKAIGPKHSVLVVLALWLLLFATTLVMGPDASLALGPMIIGPKLLFASVVAPLAGLGLAGVWSTSRVLLTALTPVERSGEYWGLYNLSGRTASVFGDATWSIILTICGEGLLGYRLAIVALAAYVAIGAVFIATLPDARPSSSNFLARPG